MHVLAAERPHDHRGHARDGHHPGAPRGPRCRTSSRPTTRRPTSRAWSPRRSRRCRPSPRRSRSSPSTTARATRRRRSPTRLAAAPSRTSSASSTTRRTSATARRSARASRAARYELVAFTDGDRQFKVADLGRLTARLAEPDAPDVVVGFRIKRADPLIRTLYARAYRLANRIFFGLKVTDVDCACKLFRREALEGLRVESGGAFFSAELLIKLRAAGRPSSRSACPTTRGRPARRPGAKPSVVWRAVRDFWRLRLRMWANRRRARSARGAPILGELTRRGLDASSSGAALARSGSRRRASSRIAEDVEPRVDQPPVASSVAASVPGSPASSSHRRLGSDAGPVEDGRGGEDPRPRRGPPGRSRRRAAQSTSMVRPSAARTSRAWNVSSARSAMTTRSIGRRAPRASSRTGRGSAGAPASGPGASSRSRWPPTGRSRSAGSGRGRSP